jgi:hypothetical protein
MVQYRLSIKFRGYYRNPLFPLQLQSLLLIFLYRLMCNINHRQTDRNKILYIVYVLYIRTSIIFIDRNLIK